MDKKPSWWQMMKVKIGLGVPFAPTEDLGQCDEVVIKYKDMYISLLISVESGEIKSMGWSKDPHMFRVNINDYWTAVSPKPETSGSRDSVASRSETATTESGKLVRKLNKRLK